jgi:hypothetical protein
MSCTKHHCFTYSMASPFSWTVRKTFLPLHQSPQTLPVSPCAICACRRSIYGRVVPDRRPRLLEERLGSPSIHRKPRSHTNADHSSQKSFSRYLLNERYTLGRSHEFRVVSKQKDCHRRGRRFRRRPEAYRGILEGDPQRHLRRQTLQRK